LAKKTGRRNEMLISNLQSKQDEPCSTAIVCSRYQKNFSAQRETKNGKNKEERYIRINPL
jgi:hypothetical protein